MKIKSYDYEKLKVLLKGVIEEFGSESLFSYKERLHASGNYKDFGRRWRWDLFNAIKYHARVDWLDLLRAYDCNDDHIDTALRKATKELGL